MKHFKKAFSLMELSVVILITGIIMIAIASGAQLIKKSRLANAQLATARSGIIKIPDLAVWLETTDKTSVETTESKDGSTITTWHDLNTQNLTKNNATQSTTNQKPTYVYDGINGIPAMKFDGSNDNFSMTNVCGYNFSVFVVLKPISAQGSDSGQAYSSSGILNADVSGSADDIIPVAITANGKIQIFTGQASGTTFNLTSTAGIIDGKSHIITTTRSMNTQKIAIYIDGTSSGTLSGTPTNALNQNSTLTIGGNIIGSFYFNGYIGEIIIFSRQLYDEERKAVEKYLSGKWAIDLTS